MFEKFLIGFVLPEKRVVGIIIALLLVASFFVFLFLTYAIANQGIFLWDIQITRSIQSYTYLTFPMIFVSEFGQASVSALLFILIIGFLFRKGYRKEAAFVPAVLLTPALNGLLKELVARPRPHQVFVNVFEPLPQYSYPSGHVMYYVVFFGFLAFLAASLPKLEPRWRILWLVISLPLMILVGVSRIYLGAHWPSDVAGAYLFGGLYLAVLILVYLKYIYKLSNVGDEKNQTNNGRNN
jgi:membrane-associated phospholipid phosphatase